MTQEEAIRQLKNQIVPNGQPVSIEAIAMAVSALEKEKEPAPSANGTSPDNNNSVSNDNIKLKKCQEVIDAVATELIEYYQDQLSGEEQKAWDLGEVYRKVLDAQDLLEEGIKNE